MKKIPVLIPSDAILVASLRLTSLILLLSRLDVDVVDTIEKRWGGKGVATNRMVGSVQMEHGRTFRPFT